MTTKEKKAAIENARTRAAECLRRAIADLETVEMMIKTGKIDTVEYANDLLETAFDLEATTRRVYLASRTEL